MYHALHSFACGRAIKTLSNNRTSLHCYVWPPSRINHQNQYTRWHWRHSVFVLSHRIIRMTLQYTRWLYHRANETEITRRWLNFLWYGVRNMTVNYCVCHYLTDITTRPIIDILQTVMQRSAVWLEFLIIVRSVVGVARIYAMAFNQVRTLRCNVPKHQLCTSSHRLISASSTSDSFHGNSIITASHVGFCRPTVRLVFCERYEQQRIIYPSVVLTHVGLQ